MKYVLTLLLALSFTASAGIIPPTFNGIDDSGDGLFTLTDFNGVLDDSGVINLERQGQNNSGDHEFGFYHYDPVLQNIASMLAIFDNTVQVGDDSNIVWDLNNQTALTRFGSIDLNLAQGYQFGFYFRSDNRYYYSQELLNFNGNDYFGFYWNDDPFSNTNLWVHGQDNGTGRNYDFMQVAVSDVDQFSGAQGVPVPEPATLLLFGGAIAGLGFSRKLTRND